jgi:hypothetical protein
MEEKKIVENVTWLIYAKTKPALQYFRELLRKTFELEERNQIKEILNKLTELHTIHNQIKRYKSCKVEGKYEHFDPLYAFDYSYLVINDPPAPGPTR